ncbi:MAG: hypothetical protein ACHRXM_25320 [Isosphaerales bacterium]
MLDRLTQTTDEAELRAFLDHHLKDEVSGKESRAKTTGIILRVWSGIPSARIPLRDRAMAMLPRISGQERIWLHWGMTALAYPFFRDVAEVVGRLLALQDDFTTAQVQGRMLTTWGDRATSKVAVPKLIATLVDWEVLRSTKTTGHFLLARKMTASIPELQLWLLEALLGASEADEIEARQVLRLPESFPFNLSIGLADLRKHQAFNIHRQGLDMDMVSLRPVKKTIPVKSPKKPARKAKQPAPSLFQGISDEMPKTLVAPPMFQDVIAAATVPVEEPRAKPERISASTMAQPVEKAMPKPDRTEPRAGVFGTERLTIVRDLDLPHNVPFSAPIGECVRLFHESLDFACVALAHDTIDAILRLICRVKLGARQAKCADIRSQFGGLTAIGVLPIPMKTRLEKLWYERVDYLELSKAEAFDRSVLEEVASSHVSVLVELVRLFLGQSSVHGSVLPDHPEYWNQGKKKLPFRAETAG